MTSALLRLLQLSSAGLPVGGFAYSQGLEYAVESGWVSDLDSTEDWLALQLSCGMARLDLPVLLRQLQALEDGHIDRLSYWNDYLLASRETHELLLADTAMGAALAKLLNSLSVPTPQFERYSFASLFAAAAHHWQIPADTTATGYCWSWLENQVAAATKLVPLGQTQAQTLLGSIQQDVPDALQTALTLSDNEIGSNLPGVIMASCLHETQYTRLFRS